MLAGTLPFKSRKFVELREERSTQDPTPLRTTLREKVRIARATRVQAMKRDVPAALEQLVMACLARDPAQRPASMAEVAGRLEAMRSKERTHLRVVASSRPRAAAKKPVEQVLRTAFGYAAAAAVLFISSSTLISDVHARGARDHSLVVAAR
jgi:hypothetical protein